MFGYKENNIKSNAMNREEMITFNKKGLIYPRESILICKHNSISGIRSISGALQAREKVDPQSTS